MADEDRVALSAIKFASAESAGERLAWQCSELGAMEGRSTASGYHVASDKSPELPAGAKCITTSDGEGSGSSTWLEASMEQLCVPLPPWAVRAGARETIYFDPKQVNAAGKSTAIGQRGAGQRPASMLALLGTAISVGEGTGMRSRRRVIDCAGSLGLHGRDPALVSPLLPAALAVVTCGGLCPGLNDVVQGLVKKLYDYGVPEGNVMGIKYGERSTAPLLGHLPLPDCWAPCSHPCSWQLMGVLCHPLLTWVWIAGMCVGLGK